jgi:hypothetical protein
MICTLRDLILCCIKPIPNDAGRQLFWWKLCILNQVPIFEVKRAFISLEVCRGIMNRYYNSKNTKIIHDNSGVAEVLMPNGLTLQVSRYVLHERACECSRGAQDPSSSSCCVHFFQQNSTRNGEVESSVGWVWKILILVGHQLRHLINMTIIHMVFKQKLKSVKLSHTTYKNVFLA